ncbi:MAG TPA: hypothetical protein VFX59_29005 [Polyangiales bacterium]|nr:hypothetical protein [Polyangiales bacterium]
MKIQLALASLSFVVALALVMPASADVGLGGGALIGTGVDTGDVDNNPYRLQLGAYGELDIGNFLVGVRGTRSVASNDDCVKGDKSCPNVRDLRTIGGDVGYIWHLPLIHFGPRLGIGHLKEKDGDRVGAYFEPGASLDVHLLVFNVGAEVRYRFVTGTDGDLNAFLAYLRLGLHFGG